MAGAELVGKVAIVTGAGRLRGIGRAAAVALAELGCDLVVTGTGRDPASFPADEKAAGWRDIESTADQVRALGRRCLPLVVDVSREADVDRLVGETVRQLGRVDILVNNAAYARGPDRAPAVELDPAVFRRVFEIKVVGAFLCARAVAAALIRQGQGGRIVNISSIASQIAAPNQSAYAAANAALETMTRNLAKELAPHDIRVNAICPGVTDTARMDDLGRGELWEASIETLVPLRRAASDEEVGAFVAMLCTEVASYVTGQIINVDGGMALGGPVNPRISGSRQPGD